MRIVVPGETVHLYIFYQENGSVVTGLIDLTVEGKDENNNTVLSSQTLTEVGSTGEYYYDWDTMGISLEKQVKIVFKKGSEILVSEDFVFDIIEDTDGVIL